MIIKNVKVFRENGVFEDGEIYVDGELIAKEASGEDTVVDGGGCYAIPGLTDVHFHGCVGRDFCEAKEDAIEAIAEHQAACGITTICPATLTLSEEKLMAIAASAKNYVGKKGAILCGINMEGPFICKAKKGAQKLRLIFINRMQQCFGAVPEASGGLFKLVDMAPEVDGAMEFIDEVKDRGYCICGTYNGRL